MRILIIARTIYPLLGPRPFRATELAKQLAKEGHDVTLYAVLGQYDYTQFSKDYNVKIKNIPNKLSTSNSDGKSRYNVLDKIAYHALNRWLEFPDIEFCWKVPKILKEERDIDLLITIAVPHPIHWGAAIARKILKQKFPRKWISDCGDPYTGNSVGKTHPFYFKYIEKFWGNQTDYVTIPVKEGKKAYLSNVQNKIHIIPQGFNMENIELSIYHQNKVPHFCYSGSVYPGQRDPSSFLDYLTTLKDDFIFTVITNNPNFYTGYKEKLGNKLNILTYKPREELLKILSSQDFLINLKNPTNIQSPSKLIDYYISQRPIIDISTPFTEETNFLSSLHGHHVNDHEGEDVCKYDIRNVANQFLSL